MKQDKEGYVLTLRVHPDEVPEALLRDYCGARYQCVMVRLSDDEKPVNRDNFSDVVRLAGMLCRDQTFANWLVEAGSILEANENNVIAWMKHELGIQSRAELKTNKPAADTLKSFNMEFQRWKRNG